MSLSPLTSQVNDGSTGEVIGGYLSENLESSDHAACLARLQEVNEEVQPTRVSDGQLTGLLLQVKLHEGTESYHSGCLVATLQVLDEFLDLPVLTGQVSIRLLYIYSATLLI